MHGQEGYSLLVAYTIAVLATKYIFADVLYRTPNMSGDYGYCTLSTLRMTYLCVMIFIAPLFFCPQIGITVVL